MDQRVARFTGDRSIRHRAGRKNWHHFHLVFFEGLQHPSHFVRRAGKGRSHPIAGHQKLLLEQRQVCLLADEGVGLLDQGDDSHTHDKDSSAFSQKMKQPIAWLTRPQNSTKLFSSRSSPA